MAKAAMSLGDGDRDQKPEVLTQLGFGGKSTGKEGSR